MKQKIWATLCNVKFKTYLLQEILHKYQTMERTINIFLAIASCGSIAAWAIFREYQFLWAIIIAFSQVITAIRPYIPYSKYVKVFNMKCMEASLMNVELDRMFHNLRTRKVKEDEIQNQYYSLEERKAKMLSFEDELVFKETPKMIKRANERMANFLKNNYQIEININS
jgi:hypothetical protein